jgi:hypothetical protein
LTTPARLVDALALLERLAEVLYDNDRRRLPAALVEDVLAFSARTPPTRPRWRIWLERRAKVWILVESGGGCRPATDVETWALRRLGMIKRAEVKP